MNKYDIGELNGDLLDTVRDFRSGDGCLGEITYNKLESAIKAMQAEHYKAIEAAYLEAFDNGIEGSIEGFSAETGWSQSKALDALIHKDK